MVPRKFLLALAQAMGDDARFNEAGAGGAPEIAGMRRLLATSVAASMRPGQVVPRKCILHHVERVSGEVASMRPGQVVPRKFLSHALECGTMNASMRPGQVVPRKSCPVLSCPVLILGLQ